VRHGVLLRSAGRSEGAGCGQGIDGVSHHARREKCNDEAWPGDSLTPPSAGFWPALDCSHKNNFCWESVNETQYQNQIVASPELDTFAKDGKVAANSKVDLVRSSIGVAIKAGAPKPDFKTGNELKKTLLAAKSVGYSTGPSGVYLVSLFEKMGIADQIKAKAKITTPGVPVAALIRNGEAEIGFQQVSELIHETGIDFLGPIPADIQNITVFSSGVPTGAKAQTEARALQKFLTAPAAAPVIKKHGLERVARTPSAS